MAETEPLIAVHYALERTGGLQPVVAPPYDVIDERQRAELARRSAYNVVHIDLPEPPEPDEDRYRYAAAELDRWRADGVLTRDTSPALWPLAQEYTGPDGRRRTRRGFLARVRVTDYGAGRIRPHERTHPGPKEDRLRLTRATKMNLSPIFSLFSDPRDAVWEALDRHTRGTPWGQATDDDGTVNLLWRVEDSTAIGTVQRVLVESELLIADGHHRYETARAYAEEIGGDGPHRYVLMCLVSLQDPGLTVFPTHRLIRGLAPAQHEALADALRRDFEVHPLSDPARLVPAPDRAVRFGYIDSHFRKPFMLTLKSAGVADAALAEHSDPYRRLDTAVLEALILKGTLGMSDKDIDELAGLGYARDANDALARVEEGEYDVAFFMAPTPVEQVQAVAAAGESMPPKSTYFFPKVPTGLVFNPLV